MQDIIFSFMLHNASISKIHFTECSLPYAIQHAIQHGVLV